EIDLGVRNGISLSLQTSWGLEYEDGGDRRILTDSTACRTRSSDPVPWREHLKLHHAVRDLIILSTWKDETCTESLVLRLGDPLRTLDGVARGVEQWRDVVTGGSFQGPTRTQRRHLIRYDDLGASGHAQWLALRDGFARALGPVVSCIRLK